MERSESLPIIGWREWLALPELGISAIKTKVDTGARSSALHAFDLQRFCQAGHEWVRFTIHPFQRDLQQTVVATARVIDERQVRTSSGHTELRPVIHTPILLGGCQWPIEITLTNRDVMGFRMLLGRQAIRQRFLVDPGHSFLLGSLRLPLRSPTSRSQPL